MQDNMNSKKGQAAIEFLSTYGWAVLVIVAVLIALGWLGVFNIQQQVPDRCTFPIGTLTCKDVKVVRLAEGTNHLASITLRNDFQKPIGICTVACDAGPLDPEFGWPANSPFVCAETPVGIPPGGELTLTHTNLDCYDAAGRDDAYGVGSRYVGKLYVLYGFGGADAMMGRVLTGDIVATVQPAS